MLQSGNKDIHHLLWVKLGGGVQITKGNLVLYKSGGGLPS